MRVPNLFLVIILLLSGMFCKGQDSLINALKNDVAQITPIEQQLVNTAHLAMLLRVSDSTQSKIYAGKALSLMRETDDKTSKAEAWGYLYFVYRTLSPEFKQQAVDSTMYYAQKSGDNRLIGYAYYIQGHSDDNAETEIQQYFKALDYLQKENAYKEIARICYDLSGYFDLINEPDKQQQYARLALRNATLSKNADALCLADLAMSDWYSNVYAKDVGRKIYLDSSIDALQRCLALFRANQQSCEIRFIPQTAAINLANLYYNYYPHSQIKDTAEKLIFFAQEWALKSGDMLGVCNAYGLLSQWAQDAGDNARAETLLLKANAFSLQFVRPKYPAQTYCYFELNVYKDLARLAELRGNYKQSLNYTRMQMAYQDTLLNAKTAEKLNKAAEDFTQQKMLQENAFNKKALYLSIALGAFATVSLVAFVMLYRNRLKRSTQHKMLLEAEAQNVRNEKDNAVLRAVLEKEKSERMAAEQALTQQKNELLQKEVMASSIQIIQKDELLQEIKSKLQTPVVNNTSLFREIARSIENHKALDEDVTHYKEKIANIHPDFFDRLQLQADNKLTEIDLKYAVYICMGISTKNMASMMRVELTSVRMAKYRIKQKLGLGKDMELDDFLKSVV